jgi:hypothetical protein
MLREPATRAVTEESSATFMKNSLPRQNLAALKGSPYSARSASDGSTASARLIGVRQPSMHVAAMPAM